VVTPPAVPPGKAGLQRGSVPAAAVGDGRVGDLLGTASARHPGRTPGARPRTAAGTRGSHDCRTPPAGRRKCFPGGSPPLPPAAIVRTRHRPMTSARAARLAAPCATICHAADRARAKGGWRSPWSTSMDCADCRSCGRQRLIRPSPLCSAAHPLALSRWSGRRGHCIAMGSDTEEVTGSNPVAPTQRMPSPSLLAASVVSQTATTA
jgi:hypothetical protein